MDTVVRTLWHATVIHCVGGSVGKRSRDGWVYGIKVWELSVHFNQRRSFTVTMGKSWVIPGFKHILIESSKEYVNSTDKGKHKTRTSLITRVAEAICEAVEDTDDTLPNDLEKVMCVPYIPEHQLIFAGCLYMVSK